MIARETLQQIVMLTRLTEAMQDQLVQIAELLQYDEDELVFHEGGKADRFYFVLQGKVLLEQRISAEVTVSLSAVRPGFSLGWSALLDEEEEFYSTDAICAEPTRLLSFRAVKLKALFEKDPHLGFIMTHRLLHVVKKRHDKRTEQFVKAIKGHPDLGALF